MLVYYIRRAVGGEDAAARDEEPSSSGTSESYLDKCLKNVVRLHSAKAGWIQDDAWKLHQSFDPSGDILVKSKSLRRDPLPEELATLPIIAGASAEDYHRTRVCMGSQFLTLHVFKPSKGKRKLAMLTESDDPIHDGGAIADFLNALT